jgi:hypothetical protein
MNRLAISIVAVILLRASSALAAEPTKDECIAANETAQDLRKAGKLLEARAKLALCVAASCPRLLREDCAQRLSDVDAAMPSVVFEVKDGAGNDVGAVTVTIDGEASAEKLNGRPMALDPGEHRLAFRAASGATAERTFVVGEGEKNRRERIVLSIASPTVAAEKVGAPVGERAGFALDHIPTIAYVAAGVGAVGLAIGIGTGIGAMGKHDALGSDGCAAGTCPATEPAKSDLASFHSLRDWSTVGYVVGALGLVGGGVLYFAMPTSKESSATTGLYVGPASCGLAGSF